MSDRLSIPKNWLEKMDLDYEEDQGSLILPWLIEEKRFLMRIVATKDFVQTVLLIMEKSQIPADKREKLYFELLRANFYSNDVTYSLDDEGNVYSENDCPLRSDLESFSSELKAVVSSVAHFINEIAPKLGLTVENTY
ncbi:MAG: hypothetical protein ACFFC7_02360 [Candidatus Hermodarchaeota archaeon]